MRVDDYFSDEKEIPFSVDKDLYLHPQNGKFVVNNIFSVGELDFDGNVAV